MPFGDFWEHWGLRFFRRTRDQPRRQWGFIHMGQRIIVEKDVPATMRDGTVLRANVYRPDHNEKMPVLLTRLPYGKDLGSTMGGLDPVRAAEKGYIVVVQDVRGRFASDGQWEPFIHEFNDGYDTVQWCAGLDGANGQVGMYGWSYYGMTQWQAAVMQPSHLRALFPAFTWGNHLNGANRRGGVHEWGLYAYWVWGGLALDSLNRRYRKNPKAWHEALADLVPRIDGLSHEGYKTLPLTQLTGVEDIAPYFYRWLQEPVSSPLWETLNITGRFDRVAVPAYLLGGWYDIFLGETLEAYRALTAAHTERAQIRMIIGPWAHGLLNNVIGERDFGLGASGLFIDYREDITGLQLRWFDAILKGRENGFEGEAPVKLFVMGENRWRYFSRWPVPEARPYHLYLDSAGHANTRTGDGVLTREVPSQGIADRYLYDPADPVPTHGGALLMPGIYPPGPWDQAKIEQRPDVLCYTTAPLNHDMTVIGPVSLTLYAATTAVDTDFVARLVDVAPDGRAFNLTDGVVRARYRAADWDNPLKTQPRPVPAGQVVKYRIDLWATANTFRAGHRIRLQITSSNFPRWDRNLNTGEEVGGTRIELAQQTVFHDARYPSQLHLYIL